eukprot:TRINITY_DN50402_c0_g2_i1.p1 TRINITY_DN50402_c0_g2~~TRINITY_DN50402_c0_g2_i1.p1  ORF type:complete len:120 (-),score=22.78 TRINITY_DN50402_c0_g2_i1:559-918(-)
MCSHPCMVCRCHLCDRRQHMRTTQCTGGWHGKTCKEVYKSSCSHILSVLCRYLLLLASLTRKESIGHLECTSSPSVKDREGPEECKVFCPSSVHLEVLPALYAVPELLELEVSVREDVL